MEDECGFGVQYLRETRSGSKIMVGEKRESVGLEERSELRHKRVKMRDLESVFRSEERNGRFGLDLNKEVVSTSLNHDPFYPSKDGENAESKDDLECASSVGPLDDKDSSFKAWNETKQNGFCSYSHGRKTRNEGIMEKKIELAKKQCMDQFAKIAAPSGLLNGLNPGIINHVRNKKQVHSIIESLVRSEKHESHRFRSKHGNQKKSDERKDLESAFLNTNESISLKSELPGSVFGPTTFPSNVYGDCKDDTLSLKLSLASTIVSDNTSSLSNDESANQTSVTSLSIKAANVASQWLELLNQDIKGRVSALRRSRKRVEAVIQTEFPCLISKEFGSNRENEPCSRNSPFGHQARWIALFDQMDKALSEEESQLESWQKKVREMQLQCEHGLLKYDMPNGSYQDTALHNDFKLDKDSERGLSVRAAAASIYSTCNFLSSMEKNLPCFRSI